MYLRLLIFCIGISQLNEIAHDGITRNEIAYDKTDENIERKIAESNSDTVKTREDEQIYLGKFVAVLNPIQVSAKCVLDLIDESRKFHVTCAFTILIAGCFHSVAHIINAVNFSAHYNSVYKDVNVANFKGEDPLNSVIKTVPGITGILMIVILCILSSTAVKYVRIVSYDLFWYSHHLFLIFFILLLSHPMSGLLKEQNNVLTHPPGCKMNVSDTMEKYSLQIYQICTEPVFISQKSMTVTYPRLQFKEESYEVDFQSTIILIT
ncbi:NADPH oxidase 4-like [Stegodyphus dumicola]|nr:NADPH oxidase 4-like [Stegodyphus dumicola]